MVAVTCLLIASKYEEIDAPKIFDFIKGSPNFHSRNAISSMEMKIMNIVDYNLNIISINRFLEYFEIAFDLTDIEI